MIQRLRLFTAAGSGGSFFLTCAFGTEARPLSAVAAAPSAVNAVPTVAASATAMMSFLILFLLLPRWSTLRGNARAGASGEGSAACAPLSDDRARRRAAPPRRFAPDP